MTEENRTIQRHRPKPEYFSAVKEDVLFALQELNDPELKLYTYLLVRPDGEIFGLNEEDIHAEIGLSKQDYDAAFDGLIAKGYMEDSHDSAIDEEGTTVPLFCFYSCPAHARKMG